METFLLATLPPILRVLLVTDGTVTRTLEAYFLEPIDVEVLSHSTIDSDRSHGEIGVIPGDPIIRRRVVLRGRSTRSTYAFAESVMGRKGISPDMARKLIEKRKGIGELLREDRQETYRELLSVRQDEAGEWAAHLDVPKNAAVCVRNYKIYHKGFAAIEIEEVFPQSRFKRDAGLA